MMRRLIFDTERSLGQLHDQLLDAIPEAVTENDAGDRTSMLLLGETTEGSIEIILLPDLGDDALDALAARVTAVVLAHEPVPSAPPPPSPEEQLEADLEAATDLDRVKAAMLAWAQARGVNPPV